MLTPLHSTSHSMEASSEAAAAASGDPSEPPGEEEEGAPEDAASSEEEEEEAEAAELSEEEEDTPDKKFGLSKHHTENAVKRGWIEMVAGHAQQQAWSKTGGDYHEAIAGQTLLERSRSSAPSLSLAMLSHSPDDSWPAGTAAMLTWFLLPTEPPDDSSAAAAAAGAAAWSTSSSLLPELLDPLDEKSEEL
ncbi:MAG: hypothetical protein FRX49_08062 [Trebouxia sp. A1-2]|nr:MAG: hypothetical protein FRX49_08062 [Trebouxia sp. A1-2]